MNLQDYFDMMMDLRRAREKNNENRTSVRRIGKVD